MTDFNLHQRIEAESILICDLPLSQLRLQNQKAAPWLILVPRRPETEIYQLTTDDRAALMEEIVLASQALTELYAPDKINVAALGNMVPQLHVHVIARFKNDPVWPRPVWGHLDTAPYELTALAEVKKKLQDFFSR